MIYFGYEFLYDYAYVVMYCFFATKNIDLFINKKGKNNVIILSVIYRNFLIFDLRGSPWVLWGSVGMEAKIPPWGWG